MKRNPIELAVRALKNAFVNWQLVAIRMAEGVVFIFLIVVALLATIIPAAVAAGLSKLNLRDAENATWTEFADAIGEHDRAAVGAALVAMARDGLLELDGARARLPLS